MSSRNDQPIKVFADYRIFGGRLENAAEEVERCGWVTQLRYVKLCGTAGFGGASLAEGIT